METVAAVFGVAVQKLAPTGPRMPPGGANHIDGDIVALAYACAVAYSGDATSLADRMVSDLSDVLARPSIIGARRSTTVAEETALSEIACGKLSVHDINVENIASRVHCLLHSHTRTHQNRLHTSAETACAVYLLFTAVSDVGETAKIQWERVWVGAGAIATGAAPVIDAGDLARVSRERHSGAAATAAGVKVDDPVCGKLLFRNSACGPGVVQLVVQTGTSSHVCVNESSTLYNKENIYASRRQLNWSEHAATVMRLVLKEVQIQNRGEIGVVCNFLRNVVNEDGAAEATVKRCVSVMGAIYVACMHRGLWPGGIDLPKVCAVDPGWDGETIADAHKRTLEEDLSAYYNDVCESLRGLASLPAGTEKGVWAFFDADERADALCRVLEADESADTVRLADLSRLRSEALMRIGNDERVIDDTKDLDMIADLMKNKWYERLTKKGAPRISGMMKQLNKGMAGGNKETYSRSVGLKVHAWWNGAAPGTWLVIPEVLNTQAGSQPVWSVKTSNGDDDTLDYVQDDVDKRLLYRPSDPNILDYTQTNEGKLVYQLMQAAHNAAPKRRALTDNVADDTNDELSVIRRFLWFDCHRVHKSPQFAKMVSRTKGAINKSFESTTTTTLFSDRLKWVEDTYAPPLPVFDAFTPALRTTEKTIFKHEDDWQGYTEVKTPDDMDSYIKRLCLSVEHATGVVFACHLTTERAKLFKAMLQEYSEILQRIPNYTHGDGVKDVFQATKSLIEEGTEALEANIEQIETAERNVCVNAKESVRGKAVDVKERYDDHLTHGRFGHASTIPFDPVKCYADAKDVQALYDALVFTSECMGRRITDEKLDAAMAGVGVVIEKLGSEHAKAYGLLTPRWIKDAFLAPRTADFRERLERLPYSAENPAADDDILLTGISNVSSANSDLMREQYGQLRYLMAIHSGQLDIASSEGVFLRCLDEAIDLRGTFVSCIHVHRLVSTLYGTVIGDRGKDRGWYGTMDALFHAIYRNGARSDEEMDPNHAVQSTSNVAVFAGLRLTKIDPLIEGALVERQREQSAAIASVEELKGRKHAPDSVDTGNLKRALAPWKGQEPTSAALANEAIAYLQNNFPGADEPQIEVVAVDDSLRAALNKILSGGKESAGVIAAAKKMISSFEPITTTVTDIRTRGRSQGKNARDEPTGRTEGAGRGQEKMSGRRGRGGRDGGGRGGRGRERERGSRDGGGGGGGGGGIGGGGGGDDAREDRSSQQTTKPQATSANYNRLRDTYLVPIVKLVNGIVSGKNSPTEAQVESLRSTYEDLSKLMTSYAWDNVTANNAAVLSSAITDFLSVVTATRGAQQTRKKGKRRGKN